MGWQKNFHLKKITNSITNIFSAKTAKMDIMNMSAFLKHFSDNYPDELVIMVLGGASSHRSYDLVRV